MTADIYKTYPTTSITISQDVSINSPSEGQTIKYVGGIWTNATGGDPRKLYI